VCLTTKGHVISWHEVSRGSLDRAVVHPREVFKPAITANAAAIALGHNHPSGDPEPSADDLALSRRLADAGALLGVDVLAHVIVGAASYVTLRALGHGSA
jgi:DNA repair protein RadC